MAVDPLIECFWRDLVPECCHGLESSAVYTAPPFFVESLHGRSNRSIPRLLLHMHAEEIIPTIITSNIHIGWCVRKTLTLSCLRSYEMFEVLLIVQIDKRVGLGGIRNFPASTRRISVPAGGRDSSQGGSSTASSIQGQKCTPSSSLNNSRVADITHRVTSTPSATQRWSIITPTAIYKKS